MEIARKMMKFVRLFLVLGFVLVLIPSGASLSFASEAWVKVVTVEDDFASAVTFLKSSIEEEGLTIADEGNVAEMMSRTKDVIDGAKLVYRHARIFQFCSAKLGHKLFSIAPEALGSCPLNIFIYQLKGDNQPVYIGYRLPPRSDNAALAGVLTEINQLMARIVKRASE